MVAIYTPLIPTMETLILFSSQQQQQPWITCDSEVVMNKIAFRKEVKHVKRKCNASIL